jgi:hypothetical protein
MIRKVWHWDNYGVRDGLFRFQELSDWGAATGGVWGGLLHRVAEHGILWVIAAGFGYHFLPTRWTLPQLRAVFSSWPAPAVGAILAFMAWLTTQLLSGPRANIYFAF